MVGVLVTQTGFLFKMYPVYLLSPGMVFGFLLCVGGV